MSEPESEPLSPTVTKVLDEFLAALRADEAISDDAAARLDALLRKGKAPSSDEIDKALFPQAGEGEA